ncbi:ankyrin [Ustulina deusta]|nr:ankyrin [Ustulina deusta]
MESQGLSLLAPTEGVDQSDITIDIVAVPGLGADPDRSFGSEKDINFNWLSDPRTGIRREIPGARVLLYRYDSRWLGANGIRQTLYNAAMWLLDALVVHRKGNESRPLVFLAHSMGGLVVAKALTLAVAKPELIDQMRVYECFAGAIFFGTPFRGSKAAHKGVLLASILETIKRAESSQMLQILDPQRDSLEELRNDFYQLAMQKPKATIKCIYELKELSYGPKIRGLSEIVVTKESATLDGAEQRGMECDHRQLNRFDSAQDQRYNTVRMMLRDIVQKSHRIVKTRLQASKQSLVDDDTFARLSDTLNMVDFRGIRRKIESASGDSSWLRKEPKYCQWFDQTDDASRFLWVSGIEGRGKGKVAILAVEELEELEKKSKVTGSKDVLVAYFSCDSSSDSCKPENMLKSLIWQLILKRRNLGQYVKGLAIQDTSRSMNTGQDSVSLSQLWKAFRQMLSDPSVETVYFVLNNLHSFSEGDKNTIEFFRLLAYEVLIPPANDMGDDMRKSRWMFLSRSKDGNLSEDHIKGVMLDKRNSGMLWIDLEDGSRTDVLRSSLQSYISDRVKQLATYKKYSLALQFFVTSILSKRATSALWVEVVCRLLEGIPSNHIQVRKTVEALPRSLDDLISRTWHESLSVETEGIHTSKEILRTLAIAYEDPTLDELRVMADLDSDDKKVNATQVRELIRACGPLLRIYSMHEWDDYYPWSQRVTFIHPMAKEALLSQATSRKLIGLSEDGDDQTEVKWQHGVLGLRCFRYVLTQLGVDEDSSNWEPNSGSVDAKPTQDKDEKTLSQIFPDEEEAEETTLDALDYPVKFWLRHGNDSTPDFVKTLDLSHAFWSLESSARSRWWSSYAQVEEFGDLNNLTPMHVAAYFGLTPLIDQLEKSNGNADQVHSRDSWHHQPLHWAAFQGHDATMLRLLEKGADVNDGAFDGVRTPLHMAAESGQIRAMELLMGKGAEVNAVAKGEGTPLTLALAWNREQAAELLLSRGANSTLTSEDFDSPMALAALKGFDHVITVLLSTGGVQNMTSKKYGSALAAAASAGHSSIVSTLLPLERETESRQRALTEAAKNGYHGVVGTILSDTRGLNVDEGFEFAASLGHDEVIKELWAYGTLSPASLNNALYKAVNNEHESIVAFLLGECGASANATGEEYGNVVTASAFDGTKEILNMLIEANANLNDVAGWPLQAAASQGMMEVVELLLRNGAAVNAVSREFPDGTALQAAVVAGHTEIARLLLDHGADANLGAGPFTNPITAAVSCRHSELIELLLSRRANPNVFGGSDKSTPLINAAFRLPAKDLEVLIRYGARVDTPDSDEDTALIISAYCGDDDCIKCLLNHGANVNFCGKNRGTALHAAAARGWVETCRLLLTMGADPTIRGGPYDTVLQAACFGGEREVVQLALCAESIPDLTLRNTLRRYSRKVNVNAQSQASEFSTALHAAAAEPNDACLRLLLRRKPALNVINKNGITPLQAACLAGCNRNARLLLEAGANPNMAGGAHGTALQAAALKGSPELIDLLLERGARTTEWRGKYYSPLVAAVVRDYHWYETDVLEKLLARDFSVHAYRAALERAFFLGRKDAFRLIWKSAEEKGPKKLPNLGLKGLLTYYTDLAQQRQVDRTTSPEITPPAEKEEDENEDFSFYPSQDIEDDVVYTEDTEDGQGQQRGVRTATPRTTRGIDGDTDVDNGGFYGQQNSRGDVNGPGAGYPGGLPIELSPDGDGERRVEDAGQLGEVDQDVTSREIQGEGAGDETVEEDGAQESGNEGVEDDDAQGSGNGEADDDDAQGGENEEGDDDGAQGGENEEADDDGAQGSGNEEAEDDDAQGGEDEEGDDDNAQGTDNGDETDAQADDFGVDDQDVTNQEIEGQGAENEEGDDHSTREIDNGDESYVQANNFMPGEDRSIGDEGISEPYDQDGDITSQSYDTQQAVVDEGYQDETQQYEAQQYEAQQVDVEPRINNNDAVDMHTGNPGSGFAHTFDEVGGMFSAIGDASSAMSVFRDARDKFKATGDVSERTAVISDATTKVSNKFSRFMRHVSKAVEDV